MLFTAFFLSVTAQTTEPEKKEERQDLFAETEKDSLELNYFYTDYPHRKFTFSDTSLGDRMLFDPSRLQTVDHAHLGTIGSAMLPLFWEAPVRKGFSIGTNAFEGYRMDPDSLPFYESDRGFTEASYSTGNEQDDSGIDILFSRKFSGGVYFSIGHKSIGQRGETYHFLHQNARQSRLNSGLHIAPPGSRYKLSLYYFANISEQEDNGGIPEETPGVENPFEETVTTQSASTRHAEKGFQLTQHLGLLRNRSDSLEERQREFTLFHKFRFTRTNHKFSETDLDSLKEEYYGEIVNDPRGLRHYLELDQFDNTLSVRTYRTADASRGTRSGLLEAGVFHRLHKIYHEPISSERHNLFLFGKASIRPAELLDLTAYAQLGLWDNQGDYRISGEVLFNFGKFGVLRGRLVNQLNEPSLIQEELLINQEFAWQNDFGKTLASTLSGKYSLPSWKISADVNYHLVNNLIYFDPEGIPRQTGIPVNILQVLLRKNFRLWRIHLDNTVGFQTISESFIERPELYFEHSLYFQGPLFSNKLELRFGVDARLINAYRAPTYFPLSGQFILQEDQEIAAYPSLDIAAGIRVQTFRFFFRMENVAGWFGESYLRDAYGQRYYYQLARYPYPNNTIRWGINWLFGG